MTLLVSPFYPLEAGTDEERRNHWEALRASRWVAERTAERLADALCLFHERVEREALPAALADRMGLAFFGHGAEVPDRFSRDDDGFPKDQSDLSEKYLAGGGSEALLDRHNAHLLAGRWLHAFACRAGTTLVDRVVQAGATCAVGYRPAILMEWTPEDTEGLPPEIHAAFVRLVTGVTVALAAGIAEEGALLDAIASEEGLIIQWCDENPGKAPGVGILAQQLMKPKVVRRQPG